MGNPKTFDITLFGFIHGILFLCALARLLYVTYGLPMCPAIWALMILVLTDVGYVAYWNSLYTQPASCLWFLFFLGESLDLCKTGEVSFGQVSRWSAFALLWIATRITALYHVVFYGILPESNDPRSDLTGWPTGRS